MTQWFGLLIPMRLALDLVQIQPVASVPSSNDTSRARSSSLQSSLKVNWLMDLYWYFVFLVFPNPQSTLHWNLGFSVLVKGMWLKDLGLNPVSHPSWLRDGDHYWAKATTPPATSGLHETWIFLNWGQRSTKYVLCFVQQCDRVAHHDFLFYLRLNLHRHFMTSIQEVEYGPRFRLDEVGWLVIKGW